MSLEKLEKLNPSEETISTSINTEELSMKRFEKMLQENSFDKDSFNVAKSALRIVAQMRVNLKTEISIKARIIKDVATDQKELKMYIEATFPSITKYKGKRKR